MDLANPAVDRTFWSECKKHLEVAFQTINASVRTHSSVTLAVERLRQRASTAVDAILVLRSTHPTTYRHEGCVLLRVIFDAYLQASYIVSDRTLAHERAQDYFDFYHIERDRLLRKIAASALPIAKKVMESPLREKNEAFLVSEFRRVAPRFRRNKRYHTNWYRMDLRKVAERTGIVHEYDFVISALHASVHCSAFGMQHIGVPAEYQLCMGAGLVLRLVGHIADFHGVTLAPDLITIIDTFKKLWLNEPRE